MGAIYIFAAFIWMLICILSLAYMCLCMLQVVVLHHIDPKVQALLHKQDRMKHPKSQKKSQTDFKTPFSKQLNTPSERLPLLWLLGNRQTKEGTPTL